MGARWTREEAERLAAAIKDSADPNTTETARRWVEDWFAGVYGWPLTTKEASVCNAFAALVADNL